jgi:uncharacterized protein
MTKRGSHHKEDAMTAAELVQSQYESLSKGDVAGVLAVFADDCEFRLAEGHPYQPSGQPWFGKAPIVEHFFKRAAGNWDGWHVLIDNLVEHGDDVVVECRYRATFKPTGRAMDVQACHVWRFRDGKAQVFHQYIDTAALQAVMTD